jgi:hypothetical protein
MSQTGVSREGTEDMIRGLPLNDDRLTGERSLASAVKSGAASPTLTSFPIKVKGLPLKVTSPFLSVMQIPFINPIQL